MVSFLSVLISKGDHIILPNPFFFIWVVSSVLFILTAHHLLEPPRGAYHDGLTQALNRKHIEKYVRTRLKNKKSRDTLLLIDFDDFKRINDEYGHAVGDHVLIVISDRLRKFVRKTDKVGRIGGDEFMVYLQDIATPEHVEALIEKLREKISYPIEYKNHTIFHRKFRLVGQWAMPVQRSNNLCPSR